MINTNYATSKNYINCAFGIKRPVKRAKTGLTLVKKSLNRQSEASLFFGVNDRQSVYQKLENHINLALLKSKDVGIISSFPRRAFFSVDKPKTLENAWNHIWTKLKGRKFDELLKSPARLTFEGIFFGQNGTSGTHTIGILYDQKSKTLFCLDSLSNLCKKVKEYQYILKTQIFNSPNGEIKKIIFSNKPQQNWNEYTCNNWTIANLEALQKHLKTGAKINNTNELNAVLPDDINFILDEQYKYVLKNR